MFRSEVVFKDPFDVSMDADDVNDDNDKSRSILVAPSLPKPSIENQLE